MRRVQIYGSGFRLGEEIDEEQVLVEWLNTPNWSIV